MGGIIAVNKSLAVGGNTGSVGSIEEGGCKSVGKALEWVGV